MNLLQIFITSAFTENIILTKFLGICPLIGTSKKESSAIGMGISVLIVMLISSIITYLIYNYILIPTNTIYLRTLLFILVISSMVQIIKTVIKKYFLKLDELFGIFLPLIATNCAILGTTLLNVNNNFNFVEMFIFTIGAGIGYLIVIYLFSTIRERLDRAKVPNCFKGVPIALIIISIISLLFSSFF